MQLNFTFDLLLGITILTIVASLFLALMVARGNRKSWTNRLFILLNLSIIFWSIASYFSFIAAEAGGYNALILIRLVLFFVIPFDLLIFLLIHTFPGAQLLISRPLLFFLILIAAITGAVVFSPYVFTDLTIKDGLPIPTPGPLMPLFAFYVLLFMFLSFYFGFKRFLAAQGTARLQWKYVLTGLLVMYALLVAFNFLAVVFWNDSRFVKLGPTMTLPFVVLSMYAVLEHRLLYIKVIPTKILVFAVLSLSFLQIFQSSTINDRFVAGGIFLVLLGFGVRLVGSVTKEVEQREELERLNKVLGDEKKKVEELSQFKTQLLSLASHQVKAPLATIKQFATILLQGLYGPMSDKVRETVEKMKNSSDNLIQLIDTLLSVRQIEEGRMQYSFERIKFKDLVQGVVTELEPQAKVKNLQFSFTASTESMTSADAQKLRQVVQNLIDNAIKYTPEGSVKVELIEDAGWFTFSVKDSGLGINPELLPHLFEEFIREERVKKQVRGTGLGLFIARKIVEAHGGRIWAESDGEGKGSTFRVRLRVIK